MWWREKPGPIITKTKARTLLQTTLMTQCQCSCSSCGFDRRYAENKVSPIEPTSAMKAATLLAMCLLSISMAANERVSEDAKQCCLGRNHR